jgi:hypothetical protein
VTLDTVREAVGRRTLLHDRDREEHYNLASAFIKSLRASDPDAALYYAARLLAAGDDLLFLARRLVIFASEDVGNADPTALGVATAAVSRGRADRYARRPDPARPGDHPPRLRAQEQRRLPRARPGARSGRSARVAAGAAPPAQRAHPPHGRARLRDATTSTRTMSPMRSSRAKTCPMRSEARCSTSRPAPARRALSPTGSRPGASAGSSRSPLEPSTTRNAKPRWLCNDCARSNPP